MFVGLCRCKSNVWLAAGGAAIFSLSEETAEEMSVLDFESHLRRDGQNSAMAIVEPL